ncbi:MAG TPA: ATP synthase F1 subunit epsilon [bacterium]|nr:ATP synthase F1 subunit epsilon [bacterium]
MSKTLNLQVVAPDAPGSTEEATLVVLPGEMGEFGVMAGHMSLLSTLKPGTLRVVKGGQRDVYFVAGGFAEVNATSVIVLAEEYVPASEIDVEEARRVKQRSAEILAEKKEGTDLSAAQNALARAEARLKTAEEFKNLKK